MTNAWTAFRVWFWPALLALSACTASAPRAPVPRANGASPSYGPLSFNQAHGADFYIAQNGRFAPASVKNGVIVVRLQDQPFQIGTNVAQVNICLSQVWAAEVQADPSGFKASCLSGAKAGARPPNSDALLVYSGKLWSDGSSTLMDSTSMKAAPLPGYRVAYQIDDLLYVGQPNLHLRGTHGTLYGYIVVYKHHERSNSDIMPMQLVFE